MQTFIRSVERVGAGVFGAIALALTSSVAPALSQQPGDITVFERPSYVGTCRGTEVQLTVFADTSRTRTVGQVPAFSRVTLTGVVGLGLVQLQGPVVGWVDASQLKTNCNPQPPANVCFQVTADELLVRSAPYGTYLFSVFRGDRVFANRPPQRTTTADGRVWMRITSQSRTGWLAETGTGGVGSNLTPCP